MIVIHDDMGLLAFGIGGGLIGAAAYVGACWLHDKWKEWLQ